MNLLAALAFDEGFTKRLLGQKDTGDRSFLSSRKRETKDRERRGGRERGSERASEFLLMIAQGLGKRKGKDRWRTWFCPGGRSIKCRSQRTWRRSAPGRRRWRGWAAGGAAPPWCGPASPSSRSPSCGVAHCCPAILVPSAPSCLLHGGSPNPSLAAPSALCVSPSPLESPSPSRPVPLLLLLSLL